MKFLIYFCMFGKKDYLNLVNLLALSIKIYGSPAENIHFLAITSNEFVDELNVIFNKLEFNFSTYVINNENFLYLLSSRLLIFNYPNIHSYTKILYIDTDILITNNINVLFNLGLENKLYALEEGIINDIFHGYELFDFSKYNPNTTAFTSGILLFNHCDEIRDLFKRIIEDINDNLRNNKIKPKAYDQAFINYHAIKDNLYNNSLLKKYAINNPEDFKYNNHVISHFPGGVGNYTPKFDKMNKYLLFLFDLSPLKIKNNNFIINKKYDWKHDCHNINGFIHFEKNNLLTSWGDGQYEIINNNTVKAIWCNDWHILILDQDKKTFISIRRKDNNISKGSLYK